ncbi:choline dehydrogenase 6 [Tritrichomonas musculus]|uniref:Choline dehydrogenase 6 n=1 Tax=Tritrichomonas musculus TaxID=1915356 RepID=A0ABR2GUA4_9EUKA
MNNLDSFIDFGEFGDFQQFPNADSTSLAISRKNYSPSQPYIFKIFNFTCYSSKNQKIILNTFYQTSNHKLQYLKSYTRLSFSFQSQLTPTFSMKYFTSKTLSDVLSTPSLLEALNFENILDCLFAVSEGMLYLHNHLIYHGNLCPSNIVIDQAEQFYLCDFGLYPIKKLYLNESQMFNREYKDPYMSSNEPTFKNDVYSFGVLMCDLLLSYIQSGNNGSNGKSRQMRLQEFIIGNARESDNATKHQTLMEFIRNPSRSKFDIFPTFFSELVALCMNSFVSERPSFKQIVERFKSSNETVFGMNIQQMHNKFINSNYILNLASIGDSYALNKVGSMYEQGKVFEKNSQLAMKYYKQAADLRNSKAQNKIGLLLQKNAGTNKSELIEGAHYLRLSAEQGNIQGMANYGIALLYGRGVEKNIQKAEDYLKKSADLGCSYAQVNYGYTLLDNNPTISGANEGLSYIKQAMNQNSPDAYYKYGVLLQNGQFVEQDDKLAMENFKIAADMGFDDAIIEYAEGNLDGKGVPKNDKVALEYYEKAYEKGNEEVKDIIETLKENEYSRQTQERAERNSKMAAKELQSEDSDLPPDDLLSDSSSTSDLSALSTPKKSDDERHSQSAPSSQKPFSFDLPELTPSRSSSRESSIGIGDVPSEPQQIFTFSPATSPNSSANCSQELPTNNAKSADKIKLPLKVSPKIILNSLGEIVYDRPNYHNENYIYPVGYQVDKEYYSIADPSKQTIYRSTVLDGGESPIFKVECLDSTRKVFEGNNPSKPWRGVMSAIEDTKIQLGMQTKNACSVSGTCAFGFPLRNVTNMIEELPNAEKCRNYKFKNYNGANRQSQKSSNINEKVNDSFLVKEEKQSPTFVQSYDVSLTTATDTAHNLLINPFQMISIPLERSSSHPVHSNVTNNVQQPTVKNEPQRTKSMTAYNPPQAARNTTTTTTTATSSPPQRARSVLSIQKPSVLDDQKVDLSKPTDELFKLGDAFLESSNQQKALECYEECLKRGDMRATVKCGQLCTSYNKQLEYYELGIENQVPEAFSMWRKEIMKRVSLTKNKEELLSAARRFEKLDDFSDAAYAYFQMKDKLNYSICYEKAKLNIDDIKDGYQQYYFSILNKKLKDFETEKLMLQKSSENGVPRAAQTLEELNKPKPRKIFKNKAAHLLNEGINYFEGRNNYPINIDEAMKMFKQASSSDTGCPKADYYIGLYYKNDFGAYYLKKSAEAGDPDGMNRYAMYLKNGFLVGKDTQKAMEYFKNAADKGQEEAAYEYGREKYENGTSEKEKNEGISYLKKSAEKLFPNALYLYSKIIKDTNPYDSKKLFEFSIEKGSKLATLEQEMNFEEKDQQMENSQQIKEEQFSQQNLNFKFEPLNQVNKPQEQTLFQINKPQEQTLFQINKPQEQTLFQINKPQEQTHFQTNKPQEQTLFKINKLEEQTHLEMNKPQEQTLFKINRPQEPTLFQANKQQAQESKFKFEPLFEASKQQAQPTVQANKFRFEPLFEASKPSEQTLHQASKYIEHPNIQENKIKIEPIFSQESNTRAKASTSVWKKAEESTISHTLQHKGIPLTATGQYDWSKFRELCGLTNKTNDEVEKYVTDFLNTNDSNSEIESDAEPGNNDDEDKVEDNKKTQRYISGIKRRLQVLTDLRRAFINHGDEAMLSHITSYKRWKVHPAWTPRHELLFFKHIANFGWGLYKPILTMDDFKGIFDGEPPKILTQDKTVIYRIEKVLESVEDSEHGESNVPKSAKKDQLSDIRYNLDGSPVLPIKLTSTMTLISLGRIVTDRPDFHSNTYIYPAGYKSSKIHLSILDPTKRVRYINEIVDVGEKMPIFRVTMEGDQSISFEGLSPTSPWSSILDKIREKKAETSNEVPNSKASGPTFFGLTSKVTDYLIRRMPGANECFQKKERQLKLEIEKLINANQSSHSSQENVRNYDDEDEDE